MIEDPLHKGSGQTLFAVILHLSVCMGYLGARRTYGLHMQHPGLGATYMEVREFVEECVTCQKLSQSPAATILKLDCT